MKLAAYAALALIGALPILRWGIRRVTRDMPDPAWKETGIKPAERTWSIDRDHDDPRARKNLMAEIRGRRVQAQRRGDDSAQVQHIDAYRRARQAGDR